MACQLSILASFQNLASVKSYLFPKAKPAENDRTTGSQADGWEDADWGWKEDGEDDEHAANEAVKVAGTESLTWLQECVLNISPTGEFIALANEDRFCLLAHKWDPQEKSDIQMKYSSSFEGILSQEEGEKITSLLCLPLASQKRSSQGGPDWTCIIVGFNSGYVRMYTENGTLLLSQIFSLEPVVGIKCRTYEPPRHVTDAEKHEELVILYKKALVTIDGFSFFQSLRACRNQVARATASGAEQIQPPPLAYKKWALQEQDHVNDHIACGLASGNAFDQLKTASMIGGYTAKIYTAPPVCHLYVTSGIAPYVGFFYAIEGSTQPMLSDVAHAVASKLKSALFSQLSAASGWFGLGGRQVVDNSKEKKKPKIEPATSLPARFGLPDKRRLGESVVLCPDNKLAATTDSFGRVILLDIERGIAVRMWKGYRDAQVGWVEVQEDQPPEQHQNHQPRRKAIFLVIYAPRRGILEVWTAQQGPRVAAFNVSKYSRLLCPGYKMMGLNNVTWKDVRVNIPQCYLLDAETGIKVLDIPFHLALSDKNSKRARDLHILKRLKAALKDHQTESGALQNEIIDTLLDMRIGSIKQQGLERVLHTGYLSAGCMQAVLNAMAHQLQSQDEQREDEDSENFSLDYENRMLLQFCKAENRLLETYQALINLQKQPPAYSESVAAANASALAASLGLTEEEFLSLSEQLDSYHAALDKDRRVRFLDDATMSVTDFLSCFECHVQREDKVAEEGHKNTKGHIICNVIIKASLPEPKSHRLGKLLFKNQLENGVSSEFGDILKRSSLQLESFFNLLLQFWLMEDKRKLTETANLAQLVKTISHLKGGSVVSSGHNSVSPWWQQMQDVCSKSENIGTTILAALVGRSVSNEMAKVVVAENAMTGSTNSTESAPNMSEWESLTVDCTQWTVLIKQLEDLLVLQSLLKMRVVKPDKSSATPTSSEPINISVKKILSGGKGVLPEVVAKWIAGEGISPTMLCLSQEEEENDLSESSIERGEEAVEKKPESSNPVVVQLQAVQKRLPHSLDSDILMANCAWEYVLLWTKDVEIVFPLQQAVAYLKCIQNAVLQRGVASMMWQMFISKKFSSAGFLFEKVGKAPKDRLCRRDIGLSEASVEKFLAVCADLLDTVLQARRDVREVAVFQVEDLWQEVAGPTSLAELAIEQKEVNIELVEHHYLLAIILNAIICFNMRAVKPLSLFDTKGRNAFFKSLQSTPMLPSRMVDDAITEMRQTFLCRVISQAVMLLSDKTLEGTPSSSAATTPEPDTEDYQPPSSRTTYAVWPPLALRLAKDLGVDLDIVRQHHVCQLYSSGLEKMAEEVLLTVSDHLAMGSQLLLIAGQRLAHYVLTTDPPTGVDFMAKSPPYLSSWIKSLDFSQLRVPHVPIQETANLVGHVVNQLPESYPEYKTALALVELVQNIL